MTISGYLMNGFVYPDRETAYMVAHRQLANYQKRLVDLDNRRPADVEHANWIYSQIRKWEELLNEAFEK